MEIGVAAGFLSSTLLLFVWGSLYQHISIILGKRVPLLLRGYSGT